MADQPDFDSARVDREKIIDYLLGSSSFASVAKARFFGSLGFSPERWEELAQGLRAQARGASLTVAESPWGRKHIAVGEIDAPNGRRYKIVSVWIEEAGTLRLVTAYPSKEPSE